MHTPEQVRVGLGPAPPPTHGTTFPRRPRVPRTRTRALGSCDAEFHSGYLLRVGASVGAVPRPNPSCSPSAAVPSACPLAFLSFGERGGQATCLSPGLGSRGRGGDGAELGPEGGGRGSEGGLGRAGDEPRGEVRGDWEDPPRRWGSRRRELGKSDALAAWDRTGCEGDRRVEGEGLEGGGAQTLGVWGGREEGTPFPTGRGSRAVGILPPSCVARGVGSAGLCLRVDDSLEPGAGLRKSLPPSSASLASSRGRPARKLQFLGGPGLTFEGCIMYVEEGLEDALF